MPLPNRGQIHQTLRDIALATVPVVGAVLCFLLWPARSGIQSNAAATAALIQKANGAIDGLNHLTAAGAATLATVNAPCTSFHGSASCGALAQLSQTEKNVGIVAGLTALQVRQSGILITATADNLNAVGSHASGALDAFGGTAMSATATLDAGRSYFVASQPRFDLFLSHVDDLTVSGSTSLQRFNAMLADPNLALIVKNSAAITGTGAHMLLTADEVETRLAQCTLHPHLSCYLKSDLITGAQITGYLLPK